MRSRIPKVLTVKLWPGERTSVLGSSTPVEVSSGSSMPKI